MSHRVNYLSPHRHIEPRVSGPELRARQSMIAVACIATATKVAWAARLVRRLNAVSARLDRAPTLLAATAICVRNYWL